MDFFNVDVTLNKGMYTVEPVFISKTSSDLLTKGGKFYAVWDEEHNVWSKSKDTVIDLVDTEVMRKLGETKGKGLPCTPVLMNVYKSRKLSEFNSLCKDTDDSFVKMDQTLVFADKNCTKEDYSTKHLNYIPKEGCIDAYDEIMSTLYSDEERQKLEWAIGAILTGESKHIQKFIVLYGAPGTGKGTFLTIVKKLFNGYWTSFKSKDLVSTSAQFGTAPFASDPLVAIEDDGDLSKIEDNTVLNSIVSHEQILINEKFKPAYPDVPSAFLFMGSNSAVNITDAKSGLMRRLIEVEPSGRKINPGKYVELLNQVEFELGAIAYHCIEIFTEMGKHAYDTYKPLSMLRRSNRLYNFMDEKREVYSDPEGVPFKLAWDDYKAYCEDSGDFQMNRMSFRNEFANYFEEYLTDVKNYHGNELRVYNVYRGLKQNMFEYEKGNVIVEKIPGWINLEEGLESEFDKMGKDYPAQLTNDEELPLQGWDYVRSTLKDIPTSKLHYVRVPVNHIVLDFDMKDEDGNKNLDINLEAANKFPKTYAEVSKGGAGLHLHYIYEGDPLELNHLYGEHVEIKVYSGKQSLRRKLTKCNNLPIATMPVGILPLKPEKKRGDNMVDLNKVNDANHLRALILKALRKEIPPGATKTSIDFIYKILEDAYNSGMQYDVSNMKPNIFTFACNSSNHSDYCTKLISKMHFASEEFNGTDEVSDPKYDVIIFYDVEVFPNLFVLNWKKLGDNKVNRMINPESERVRDLTMFKLVGFNNVRYDNYIIHAWINGANNEELYHLSQRLINDKNFRPNYEAKALSYTDIYDYAAKKQSLKKWEIELSTLAADPNSNLAEDIREVCRKIKHHELGLPWDKPVPEELWDQVAEYCDDDVLATEAVWLYTQGDFLAREILAALAGGKSTVNDSTNNLTTRIIFGSERHPGLVYTDLATGKQYNQVNEEFNELKNKFPGYSYERGEDNKFHNFYRDEDVGFGGYVYANPGMYGRAVTLDVASMHPSSIIALNAFGKYTDNFQDILNARIAIKHKDFDKARTMLGGKLAPFLDDEKAAKNLAQALKIAINSVYGLTSAKFDNPFRDPRNENNIVALRGALFMINLKHEIEDRGFTVIHIKTDSIKIADPTEDILEFAINYGKEYGYNFEVENRFEKICLVNNAVYIAKLAEDDPEDPGHWHATGTQFAVPYVFKTLFSHEDIVFSDLCETKETKSAIYLNFDEDGEDNMKFVGKVGNFCPVKPGFGGGTMLRADTARDGYSAVTGTKGFRWKESDVIKHLGNTDQIDRSYYDILVNDAVATISKFGDINTFVD